MTEPLYVQCTLQRGSQRDVAWIPEACAKWHAVVSFGNAEERWQVTGVGTLKLPWSTVNERSRDWKRTRLASDV